LNSQVPFLSSPEEEDSSRGDGIRRLACIGISPLFLAQGLASRLMRELKVSGQVALIPLGEIDRNK